MAVTAPQIQPPRRTGAQNALAGIDWILNPQINFTEADTNAAAQALALGVPGSQFAGVNNLRLRDSERMNRIALGNQLLNPFLDRDAAAAMEASRQAGEDRRLEVSGAQALDRIRAQAGAEREIAQLQEQARANLLTQEGAQRLQQLQLQEAGETGRQGTALAAQQQNIQSQIAADAARQAIEQAGLDRRLDSEAAARLNLALMQGDQSMQELILREAGADRRQSETIRAQLDQNRQAAQIDLLRTLIGSGGRQPTGGDGGRAGSYFREIIPVTASGAPARGPGPTSSTGGGAINRYTSYINSILRQYGLPA